MIMMEIVTKSIRDIYIKENIIKDTVKSLI